MKEIPDNTATEEAGATGPTANHRADRTTRTDRATDDGVEQGFPGQPVRTGPSGPTGSYDLGLSAPRETVRPSGPTGDGPSGPITGPRDIPGRPGQPGRTGTHRPPERQDQRPARTGLLFPSVHGRAVLLDVPATRPTYDLNDLVSLDANSRCRNQAGSRKSSDHQHQRLPDTHRRPATTPK